ncbi:50S ribosomal protein L24 [Candidatus Roizmanbacteria bacterium RIFCSPHIGHO2_12_FULL_41_11]|uniref:Large ribosomal subunit protein uL24 n=3 Tax=Candidatus Roizmaniibacteriota TaxID=1752723 RepID=A0A1F7JQ33_9BACT|nr:MAG: 50S ribosomal protein L24 [Candidatus Roizmanbacteria bacterium RIFCSPHIGHO2_12_FULL_41_11]OGK51328.1 MAG: 50S ribosomal protein L24 [Candidatus Roizmanbacteria bacterium RIFCSPLOWO2_01_FULL_41_22]OGK57704.1 MAG: 50S ribosomal protein L24 [Candidatus Roizmanbacteria bacterium RIFCSPLOWO2_02_FULL_41_9]
MKLKKGDKVKITAGKDRGREGIVERVYKKTGSVIIPGVNIYKKHVKKSEQMPQGGVVDIPRPLKSAKVMLICPKCSKATRVGYKVTKDRKMRICKKCQSTI